MKLCCLFEKNAFSLCFLMVNLRICAEGLHFLVEILKMENRILVLHYWVVFLRQMIAIEIILHIVYSKNTGIYSGFCMCHILKDEDEDIYVIHPLLQVGPGRGGDHIAHIYI